MENADAREPAEVRIAVLEKAIKFLEENTRLQVGHLTTLVDSEKGTRLRLHDAWERALTQLGDKFVDYSKTNDLRFQTLEKHVWIGVGIVGVMQVIGPLVANWLKP